MAVGHVPIGLPSCPEAWITVVRGSAAMEIEVVDPAGGRADLTGDMHIICGVLHGDSDLSVAVEVCRAGM